MADEHFEHNIITTQTVTLSDWNAPAKFTFNIDGRDIVSLFADGRAELNVDTPDEASRAFWRCVKQEAEHYGFTFPAASKDQNG